MRLLLDSHAFLWWLLDDPQLGAGARVRIASAEAIVFVSAASVWELKIKERLGRLQLLDVDLVREIEENRFFELPIAARHAACAADLPLHHKDPFDRMLIAQTQLEDLTCVSQDPVFAKYGVRTVW